MTEGEQSVEAPATRTVTMAPGETIALTDPSLYINQELSWLSFNERVQEEAEDPSHPLLERIKFLAIVSTNTDEFFMIRVAGLKQALALGIGPRGEDGLTPTEALAEINRRVHALSIRQRRCLFGELEPALTGQGIHLLNYDQLDATQQAALTDYFERDIFPVLTPLAVDSGHPFPHISNLQPQPARRHPRAGRHAEGARQGPRRAAAPDPGRAGAGAAGGRTAIAPHCFVWLEQVVAANLQALFPGKEIVATYPFRVTRNADMEIQEDEAADLLSTVEASLRQRPFGFVSRLTVDSSMPAEHRVWLAEQLEVNPADVYALDGPLGLGALMSLLRVDRPDLKDPPLDAARAGGPGAMERTSSA